MTSKELDRYMFYRLFCQHMIEQAMLDAANNPRVPNSSKCRCQGKKGREEIRTCALEWIMSDDTEMVKDFPGIEMSQLPFLLACDIIGENPNWIRKVVLERVKNNRRYGSTDRVNLIRNEHIDEALRAERYTADQLAEIYGIPESTIRGRAAILGVKTLPMLDGCDFTRELRKAVWKKCPGAQIPANDRLALNKKCTELLFKRLRRFNEKGNREAREMAKRKTPRDRGGDRRPAVCRISSYQGNPGTKRQLHQHQGLHQGGEESPGQTARQGEEGE